ncbi:unnamed protein product [Dovyalis caffra]|uniref:Uncharacterized protein n=1 Tax=Dovyalis caffra TaxID=77055 RepID=A0AAV1S2P3_9ROSI|nr:unnamed protein product [Dovyalis caffra]
MLRQKKQLTLIAQESQKDTVTLQEFYEFWKPQLKRIQLYAALENVELSQPWISNNNVLPIVLPWSPEGAKIHTAFASKSGT